MSKGSTLGLQSSICTMYSVHIWYFETLCFIFRMLINLHLVSRMIYFIFWDTDELVFGTWDYVLNV